MKREETTISNIEFETAVGRFGTQRSPIDLIVLHSTAGTLQSTISLFGSAPQAGKETSAHYVIENDGKLYQGLEEYYTAYHCGNLEKNKCSIGIEHVDNGANVRLHTDAQYTMSARLVRDICQFYNIPIDSAHIVPHSSIVATACPNGLDVERIIREAKGEVVVDDCPAKLAEKTKLETELRDAIGRKDIQLEELTNMNTTLGIEVEQLKKELDKQKEVASLTLNTELSKQRDELLMTHTNEIRTLEQEHEKKLEEAKKANPEKIIYKETALSVRFKNARWKTKIKAINDILLA